MKLTNDNYYSPQASREYMSVSQYKQFLKCEAAAYAQVMGEYEPLSTQALLLGSFVDSYFEGAESFANFCRQHDEIYKKDGTLKSDFEAAISAAVRAQSDDLFNAYTQGKTQIIKTRKMFGTNWKIKMDFYDLKNRRIVDLKYMRSMERIMGQSFVEHWGYDTQLAVYEAVCNLKNIDTYLAVITKETPADFDVIEIPKWRRDECLEEVEKNMPRIIGIKNGEIEPHRCGVCPYCRATKKLTEPRHFEYVGLSDEQIKLIYGKGN